MKILLLQLKRIGDLILTTPAIAALRGHFPEARITLVASKECADLLPAIENVDHFLIARRNPRDVALFASVAAERFDYCVDFTRSDRSALLALLSRAPKRVTSYRVRDQSKTRARAYTDFAGVRVRDMHTIDFHLALLEPLGVRSASHALHLRLSQTIRDKATALRRQTEISEDFVIFHPGSARVEKLWEPDRWARVIDHARSSASVSVVLTGGNSKLEQEHLANIKAKLRRPAVDLSGKTDLLTLAALIAQARLLVTVDSAPVHLAAAMHTPQVALFGPTNPFHWRPLETPAVILQGDAATPLTEFTPVRPRLPMRQISTDAVISAMDSLLATHLAIQPS